jgi:hypothetical protein
MSYKLRVFIKDKILFYIMSFIMRGLCPLDFDFLPKKACYKPIFLDNAIPDVYDEFKLYSRFLMRIVVNLCQ